MAKLFRSQQTKIISQIVVLHEYLTMLTHCVLVTDICDRILRGRNRSSIFAIKIKTKTKTVKII